MGKKLKKQKKKLGKKVLAGKLTVEEARATLGRRVVQKSARISDGLTDYGRICSAQEMLRQAALLKATAEAHAGNVDELSEAAMFSVAGGTLREGLESLYRLNKARGAKEMLTKSLIEPPQKTVTFQNKTYEVGSDGMARVPAADIQRKY